MRKLSKRLYLAATFLLIGCAFAPVEKPSLDKYQASISSPKTFKISMNNATKATQVTLKALGYETESITPELGLMRTKPRNIMISGNCDCGSWNGTEVSGSATSVLNIQIDPQGADSVSIKIKHSCATSFTGRNLWYVPTHRETYQCASRGNVESQFWDVMQRAVLHIKPESHSSP